MFRSGFLGGADHQSSNNEKETRKKGKGLDKNVNTNITATPIFFV